MAPCKTEGREVEHGAHSLLSGKLEPQDFDKPQYTTR